MNIDANDPKWTAYALGEITDDRERMEMEDILRQSPEITAIVEDIRETAGWLKTELAVEPSERLTPAQRECIEAKASKTSGFLFGWKPAWIYATAAAVVIVIALIAVRPFQQTNMLQPEPILTAEVFEKPLTAPTVVVLGDSAEPEPTFTAEVFEKPSAAPAVVVLEHSATPEPTAIPEEIPLPAIIDDAAPIPEYIPPPPTAPAVLREIVSDTREFVASRIIPAEIPAPITDEPVMLHQLSPTPETANSQLSTTTETIAELSSQQTPSPPQPPQPKAPVTTEPRTGISTATRAGGISSLMSTIPRGVATAAQSGIGITGGIPGEIRMPAPAVANEMGQIPDQRRGGNFNTEDYNLIRDNPFLGVVQNPLSTLSISVDTASYSNMRRFLDNGSLPPRDSIRIEELINYFDYDYNAPKDGRPFAVNVEMTEAPWNPKNRLLRIGLKGRELVQGKRPDSNLVFLIDVSGSMAGPNRLPLVKESMKMLVDKLNRSDRVAIVTYANDTRLLLPSTRGDQKTTLRNVIDGLRADGGTYGSAAIQMAYQIAQENFIRGGVNRVILATDGDFNIGITNRGDLTRLIEERAKSGIFLSALGFGMDNYKDATLELLANTGRGNYAYIDNINEARKVLVEQSDSTLVAIAQDVKIQVEFNPARVGAYRLLGYENRVMAKEDFNDDSKMAGVIGAGHTVTVFYELELAGAGTSAVKSDVDPLRYQQQSQTSATADSRELATVKIRGKEPEKEESVLTEYVITDGVRNFSAASGDFKFAAAVAAFGMTLRDSPYKGNVDFDSILEWARAGKGEDRFGYRDEFIRLVHRAASLPRR